MERTASCIAQEIVKHAAHFVVDRVDDLPVELADHVRDIFLRRIGPGEMNR